MPAVASTAGPPGRGDRRPSTRGSGGEPPPPPHAGPLRRKGPARGQKTSFNFWVAENKDRIKRENPNVNATRGALPPAPCLPGPFSARRLSC